MGALREYLWLWVILVVLGLSVGISMVFVCINRWIRRQGKVILGLDRPVFVSETYQRPNKQLWQQQGRQERQGRQEQPVRVTASMKSCPPQLPPRTLYMTQVPEAPSYENLAEGPDYENPDGNCTLDSPQPEYLKVENGPEPPFDPEDEDYDDIDAAEEEEMVENGPEPPFDLEDEDYDDIDAAEENSDYDDVG